VALVALENNPSNLDAINQSARPENALSLDTLVIFFFFFFFFFFFLVFRCFLYLYFTFVLYIHVINEQIRDGNNGLIYWLKLPDLDSKDGHAHESCANNIANMVWK